MTTTYVMALLRSRAIRAQILTYALSRLPSGMMILALLLQVHARLGALSGTGGVVAAYSVTVACVAPLTGRLLDRIPARRILPIAAGVHLTGALIVAGGHTLLTLCAGAMVAGAGLPSTPAYIRSNWHALDEQSKSVVFSVDGVILELANLIGPLIVALLLGVGSTGIAVVVTAGCSAVAALVAAFALPGRQPEAASTRHWLGPLRQPRVLALLTTLALVTAGFAFVEVATIAYAAGRHHPALAAVLFSVTSVGSIVGGGLLALRRNARPLPPLLPWFCLLLAAGFALLPLGRSNIAVFGLLLMVGAAAAAPVFAALFSALSDAAPEGQRVETFTWVSSSNFAAISVGTLAAGQLLSHATLSEAFLTAAGVLILAAAVARPGSRTSTRARLVPV